MADVNERKLKRKKNGGKIRIFSCWVGSWIMTPKGKCQRKKIFLKIKGKKTVNEEDYNEQDFKFF